MVSRQCWLGLLFADAVHWSSSATVFCTQALTSQLCCWCQRLLLLCADSRHRARDSAAQALGWVMPTDAGDTAVARVLRQAAGPGQRCLYTRQLRVCWSQGLGYETTTCAEPFLCSCQGKVRYTLLMR